jgi:hypothetical protein
MFHARKYDMAKKSASEKDDKFEVKEKVTEALLVNDINDHIITDTKMETNQFEGMDDQVDEALPISERVIVD